MVASFLFAVFGREAEMTVETPLMMHTGEAARHLGISHARLLQLTDRGELTPVARTADGWRLYSPADVKRLAEQRARRTAGTGPQAA